MSKAKAKKTPQYTFEVDFTQMVETLQVVDAISQSFSREDLRNEIVQRIGNEARHYMNQAAIKSSEKIAHAFTWEEIFEEGARSFEVRIGRNPIPLFKSEWRRAGISKRSGDALLRIKAIENKNAALRDPRVQSMAKSPGNLTEHHFKDQFSELETVNIIEKMSSQVSRRASSSSGSLWRKEQGSQGRRGYNKNKRRIVGVAEGGRQLANFKDIRRRNVYHNQFSDFFLDFWTEVDREPALRKFVDNMNNKTMNEIAKVSRSDLNKHFSLRARAGVQLELQDKKMRAVPTAQLKMIAVLEGRPIISPSQMRLRASDNQVNKYKDAIIRGVSTVKTDTDYRA